MGRITTFLVSLKPKTCPLANGFSASKVAILLVGIAIVVMNFQEKLWKNEYRVISSDVVYYYSYLPAALIEHDLHFDFIAKKPNDYSTHVSYLTTPEGGRYQKMTMGLAFLYLPFFLIGHAQALLTGVKATGFSEPYFFWMVFSGFFYGITALIFLRKILLHFFTDRVVALVLLLIVLGTNLFYYLTLEAPMSHGYNFFLFILFIWLGMRWYEQPTVRNSIFIGLVYGLIGLIRPTNGLILLFFLFYGIRSWKEILLRVRFLTGQWRLLLLMGAMAFVVVFPQLLFWKLNTGKWIYYTYGEEGFFFGQPRLWRGLFSYRKGWLVYTPLMIFALAGIGSLRRYAPAFFLPVLLFVPLNIYVIYSWWDWSYGGSFGSRPMIDSYGMMAMAMGATLTAAENRSQYLAWAIKIVMILLAAFSVFQTIQYKKGIIHYAYMSKNAYWSSLFKLQVELNYYDLLEPMDYTQLLKGVYSIRPTVRQTIGPEAVNDFERMTPDGRSFASPDGHYEFNHFDNQSRLAARSGTASALLTPEKAFSSGLKFFVQESQQYQITVWKYPAGEAGSLVITSEDSQDIYQVQNLADSVDANGWSRISFGFTVPKTFNGWCRAYVWNRTADSVFFDDFSLRRIR